MQKEPTNGELMQFMVEQFASIHEILIDHTRRLVNLEVRMEAFEERLTILENTVDKALVQLVNHEGRIARIERSIIF